MARAMKALMEMEDVIAIMVGKDSFAIPVSIMKYVHRSDKSFLYRDRYDIILSISIDQLSYVFI